MMHKYICLFGLCLPSLAFASVDAPRIDEKELYFGEAFYYAWQGRHVDAITRLDIGVERVYSPGKPNPDPLHFQFGNAGFSAGDFELSYRMYRRAERAFKAISGSNADQSVRNEAVYRLARVYLQMNEPENALQSIGKITGKISGDIREDVLFLRAQIYMANGKFADAAKILRELQGADSYKGFAAYNLGVALIKSGQEQQGLDQLDKAGRISGDDDVALSIRDKANLALGYRLMDARQPELARQYLDRVRLSGPFSNKALLGSGWAEAALERFESALAPWSVLVKRSATDTSVQESMLGVPYAYARLNLPGKAALLYGKALDGFGQELTRLDASIKSVREGKFLLSLLRQELKQDRDWIGKLRALPETPETRYLLELMASDDFQESLRNYLDLDDLLNRLKSWDENLNSYEEMIRLRRSATQNYQGYDEQIRQLKDRVRDARKKAGALMTGQGQMLETMAINDLNRRRKHLQGYVAQARFALAESYERASRMQATPGGAK